MPQYFRHARRSRTASGEEGLELDGINKPDEAARGLVDSARDLIPGSESRELAIEVRDRRNVPLLRVALSFEVAVLAG
jgi:hypothetical protein